MSCVRVGLYVGCMQRSQRDSSSHDASTLYATVQHIHDIRLFIHSYVYVVRTYVCTYSSQLQTADPHGGGGV